MNIYEHQWFISVVFFLFGAVFGSFATMASYRIPRNEDLVYKPSRCPKCEHKLGLLDLFPVFSWVLSGAKCRHCKAKVSFRYPLIELSLAALFVWVYLSFGLAPKTFILCALAVVMVIMITIDIEHMIIPDSLQIAMLLLGIAYRYSLSAPLADYFIGSFLGLFIALSLRYGFYLWKKKEGLGMGDVKFFFVAGMFINPLDFACFMLLSGIIGTAMGVIWKKTGKGEEFPFAPALAIALFVMLMLPNGADDLVFIGY